MPKKYLRAFRSRVRFVLRSLKIRALKREILRWLAKPRHPNGDAWQVPTGTDVRDTFWRRPLVKRKSGVRANLAPQPQYVFEALEARVLLAADMTYPVGATDLTLTFDSATSEYRLVSSLDPTQIVASLGSSGVVAPYVNIVGTPQSDTLRLDVTRLPSTSIAFGGGGIDSVRIEADSNFIVDGSQFTVGSMTYVATGFEEGFLTGGNSSNTFSMRASTIPVALQGLGGNDTVSGPDQVNDWVILGNTDTVLNSITRISGIENLVGSNLVDRFRLQSPIDRRLSIDGGPGMDELVG